MMKFVYFIRSGGNIAAHFNKLNLDATPHLIDLFIFSVACAFLRPLLVQSGRFAAIWR